MKILSLLLITIFIVSCSVISKKRTSTRTNFYKVDYPLIEKNINDPDSKFYYDKLLSRFKKWDTTLTFEDYVHLYYGYSCLPEYYPYQNSDFEKKYNEFMKMEPSSSINDSILKYSQLIVDDIPF